LSDDIDKRSQVVAQCKVVAHLAEALLGIHADYAKIIGGGQIDQILDQVGPRTASFMQQLGDMLNSIDGCTKDDEWTHPIFEEAQRRWPVEKDTK
jgi:hypothetical protein